MTKRTPYEVLGLRSGASRAEVRRAFRRAVFRHHPDRAGAEEAARFNEVVEAYRELDTQPERPVVSAHRQPSWAPVEPLIGGVSAWPAAEPLIPWRRFGR